MFGCWIDVHTFFTYSSHFCIQYIYIFIVYIYIFIAPQKTYQISVVAVVYHEVSSLGSWTVSLGEVFFGVLPPTENVEANHLDFREHVFVWKGKAKVFFQHPKGSNIFRKKNTCSVIFCH